MNELLVYDTTALLALFRAHPLAYRYWTRADNDELGVVFPAAAVAEANRSCSFGPRGSTSHPWTPRQRSRPARYAATSRTNTWSERQITSTPPFSPADPQDYAGTSLRLITL